MRPKFRTQGWTPTSKQDHFMICPTCGERLDCRDLGDVLGHVHGEPVEEEPTQH